MNLHSQEGAGESPVEQLLSTIKGFKDGFRKQNSNKQVLQASKDVLRFRFTIHSADESENGFLMRFPDGSNNVWGRVFQDTNKSGKKREELNQNDGESEAPCSNCLITVLTQTLLLGKLGSFLQSVPSHFKEVKKCFGKRSCHQVKKVTDIKFFDKTCQQTYFQNNDSSGNKTLLLDEVCCKKQKPVQDGGDLSFELCLTVLLEFCSQLSSKKKLQIPHVSLDNIKEEPKTSSCEKFFFPLPDLKAVYFLRDILRGTRRDSDPFSCNFKFARVNGTSVLVQPSPSKEEDRGNGSPKDDGKGQVNVASEAEYNRAMKLGADAQKLGYGIVNFSVENVKRLKSVLSAMPLTDLMALVPQKGRPSQDHPDKKRLCLVQDFFKYTQSEGKRFFDELDRDGDGKITLEDLEVAMRKRRLPSKYAREFLRQTRSHIFAKSIGWEQFLSLMEQKEAAMLQAYNSLCLSKSGTLQKNQVLESLKRAGLPASEENVAAMMRYLDADTEGSISYGHFRNFMLLLPPERLEDDIRSLWFEAATVVAVPPPIPISSGAGNVLLSALAGGLSCALSTSLMHPLDTLKTRVQASTLSLPMVLAKVPEIGVRGLYRGSVPAILGQFSSHGLRTGFAEATKRLLENTSGDYSDIQVESISSLLGTVVGTAMRIPCEVLKQRLQAGIFDNVGAAIVATWQKDGPKGFFRGTGITLCREVPFYVAGAVLYTESKKVAQQLVNRELAPWETLLVGALSGGLAAVATTPFDVLKTRMMTVQPGVQITMFAIASNILQREGPLGLFKGAVPRFFWIAPLGAMNFAGYELAKKTIIGKQSHVQ